MNTEAAPASPAFLRGGGNMGALIRQHNWAATSLGPPEQWPSALRTVVSLLLDAHSAMYIAWGPDFVQLYNDAYRPILGESKHPAALGGLARDIFPEIWDWLNPTFQSVMAGQPYQAEDMLVPLHRNGYLEDCYFTFSYTPVRDEIGAVQGILVHAMETTANVVARQRNEINRRELLAMFEQAPVAVASFSGPDLIFRMANPSYGQLVGRTPEEIINKPMMEVFPELAGQGFDVLMRNVMATETAYVAKEISADIMRNNVLETIYVDLTYQPQRLEDGEAGVLVVATDITEQVRVRRRVEESEREFRQLADSMPQMVWVTWPDGYHHYYNKRWYDYTGLSYEQTKAEGWANVLHPDDNARAWATWRHSLQTGETYQIEYRMRAHDATYRWFLGRAEPVYDEDGAIAKWFGTCTDIDDQKRQTEILEQTVAERTVELRQANTELERSNFDLMQFASIASHDLKEPLRKIQLFSDLLQTQLQGRLQPLETEYLDRIVKTSQRMQALVREVLDLSSLSRKEEEFEPVELSQLVAAIIDDLQVSLEERGVYVCVGELPAVSAVPAQMHRLFQNLLSNAVKFNKSERPEISIEAVPVSPDVSSQRQIAPADYVAIQVKDNGIGFKPEQREQIFGMFQRLHGRQQYAGTGMGLTIARKITDNHRGFIEANSQPGQGATFTVLLRRNL